MNKKITAKEWLKRFAFAIVLGIAVYFLSIFVIFKPHYTELLNVGLNIIQNIGHPYLKIKAYLILVYDSFPLILMF